MFFQDTVGRAFHGPVRKEAARWAIVADFAKGEVKEIIFDPYLKPLRGLGFRKVEVKPCMTGLAISFCSKTEGCKGVAIGGLVYH